MKLLIRAICIFTLLIAATAAPAQTPHTGSMDYLKQQFPRLTNLYEPELRGMKTHYIFVVDVSGSMGKYDATVTPALQAFANALPIGEQVSVIPFGTTAKENTPGLCVRIDDQAARQTLTGALSNLYTSEAYDAEFKRNTDVQKAVQAVVNSMRNNQEAKMNVVVIITDFLNDLPGKGETPLSEEALATLQKEFNDVSDGTNTRVVAMKLDKMGSGKGYSLDQLKENVFSDTNDNRRFDIVDAISSQAAISHWFEQLTREIMTDKLRAVIQLDNKDVTPSIKTVTDIDGNTKGEIHWVPSKLYTQISIDSIFTGKNSDYIFVIEEGVLQTTTDSVLNFEKLGKLKHRNWGLHSYSEPLNLTLSLPTAYDDELKKLSIDKPVPEAAQEKSGWLWTFLLPFWTCVIILLCLLVYMLLVIQAARRNSSEKFSGRVEVQDMRGRTVAEKKLNKVKGEIKVGGTGNNGLDVTGADWGARVTKRTSSPFAFWKKPRYEWASTLNSVKYRNKKKGYMSAYGSNRSINAECGPDADHPTHTLKITIDK